MISRSVTLPVPHVPAELAAWPLASVAAFENNLRELSHDLEGPTEALCRDAETEILRHAPGMSIDQFTALRDEFWFSADSSFPERQADPTPLAGYLRCIARKALKPNGYCALPKMFFGRNSHNGDPNRFSYTTWQWRWLTFALPPDLLLAACAPREEIPGKAAHLSPTMERCLKDGGFAEVHLHVNAGLKFDALWCSLMNCLAMDTTRIDSFESPDPYFDDGKNFGPWLIRAAIARSVLAWFLACNGSGGTTFLESIKNYGELLRDCGINPRYLPDALSDLCIGRLERECAKADWARMQLLYREIIGWGKKEEVKPQTLDELHGDDPIAWAFPPYPGDGPKCEMRFIAAALEYIERRKDNRDVGFEAVFWQVVRLRCLFYRHITQRPLTPGLLWFVRHYSRLSPARKRISSQAMVQSAAYVCGAPLGLKSLEIRAKVETTDPKTGKDGLSETIRLINGYCLGADAVMRENRTGRDNGFTEFGVVIHFAKDRGEHAKKGLYSRFRMDSEKRCLEEAWARDTIAPWMNSNGLRFSDYLRDTREEARTIRRLLELNPSYLYVIRGVDVCNDELAIPTWVIKPLFDIARDAGKTASGKLMKKGESVPNLRATAHVGEDFVHLLGGLRRVDEAMTYLANERGDRLGHAVALGVDPVFWTKTSGTVAMPIEERLFDLAWEWAMYAREAADPAMNRRNFLDYEITRLSEQIFDFSIKPYYLCEAIKLLYDTDFLEDRMQYFRVFRNKNSAVFNSRRKSDPNELAAAIAAAMIEDEGVFLRGREVEHVKTSEECHSLDCLQKALREKAAKQGITVEVNPSSNLLIGDIGDLKKHPLWRLANLGGEENILPVRLAIGSDDPITFATTLPLEYQMLCDTLKEAGLSERESEDWLDRTRLHALSSRFTVPWPEKFAENITRF